MKASEGGERVSVGSLGLGYVEGHEFKFGPLFQFDTGALRWNANLLVANSEKGVRHHF